MNIQRNLTRGVMAFCAALPLVQVGFALANDALVAKKLDEIAVLLPQRSPTEAGRDKVNQALELVAGLEDQTNTPELKYEVLLVSAQINYWIGTHVGTDNGLIDQDKWEPKDAQDRKDSFKKAQEKADDAIKLFPKYADAYYYASISLGRWCQANGPLHPMSLINIPKINSYINKSLAFNIKAKDGEGRDVSGRTFDGYGPVRMKGMLTLNLAKNHIGSSTVEDALLLLKESNDNGSGYGANAIYYVQALRYAEQDAEANQVLDALIQKKESDFTPLRLPESLEAQETAKAWRNP